MNSWNIILLYMLVIATNGNIIRDLNETKSEVNANHTLEKHVTNTIKMHRKRKPVTVFKIQKPRIVLTLMSSKQIMPINESDTNRIEPFRFDPFQRFLQLFFSSFVRDLSQPVMDPFELERKDKRNSKIIKTTTDKIVTLAHVIVNATKNITHKIPRIKIESNNVTALAECVHDVFERCSKCSRGESKQLSSATVTSSTNITSLGNKIAPILPIETKPIHNEFTGKELTTKSLPHKNKRHYFLSISGGADKRAAAKSFQSDIISNSINSKQFRYRRAEMQPETTKNYDFFDDKSAIQIANTFLNKVQKEVEEIESNKSDILMDNKTDILMDNKTDILLKEEIYELVTSKEFSNYNLEVVHQSYRISKAYLFTVIFSTFIAIGVIVVALCYCIKVHGTCKSNTFLKEPLDETKVVYGSSSAVATAT